MCHRYSRFGTRPNGGVVCLRVAQTLLSAEHQQPVARFAAFVGLDEVGHLV